MKAAKTLTILAVLEGLGNFALADRNYPGYEGRNQNPDTAWAMAAFMIQDTRDDAK